MTFQAWEWSLQDSGPGAGAVRFRCTSALPDVWRIQMARDPQGFDECSAIELLTKARRSAGDSIQPPEPTTIRVTDIDVSTWQIQCSNGGSTLSVNRQGAPRFKVSSKTDSWTIQLDFSEGRARVRGELMPHEAIYGTGQRFNGANQRGKQVAIWAEDRWCHTEGNSYVPVPFLLSSRGYGLFVNRYELCTFDLGAGKANAWEIDLKHAPLDLMLFSGTPRQILQNLGQFTGLAPNVPEWSLGVFVSRHARIKEFARPEGVRGMIEKMNQHDLPWNGAVLEGWPTFDTRQDSALKVLVEELHRLGKKVLLYDTCGRMDPQYAELHDARTEYFVRAADGSTAIEEADFYNPADKPHKQKSQFIDLTNPEATDWWRKKVWRRLLDDIGIDGYKIDFCEQFPEWPDLSMHDGSAPAGWHQLYPVLYNLLMHRWAQSARSEGGMCWSRGGGIGAALYPFIWCGDQLREFRYLRAILSATLSAGLSGLPFTGHDLAGYLPARDVANNPEPEVFIRGAQLACFGLNMQTHGTVTRPYDFEKPVVDLYRTYCQIHYALVPYLKEQSDISSATNTPLVRHMILHYPDDPRSRVIDDQYFLGEDLLIAPVLDRTDSRDVYLPQGTWIELRTGRRLDGAQVLRDLPVPLSQIPVFLAESMRSQKLPLLMRELVRLAQAAG